MTFSCECLLRQSRGKGISKNQGNLARVGFSFLTLQMDSPSLQFIPPRGWVCLARFVQVASLHFMNKILSGIPPRPPTQIPWPGFRHNTDVIVRRGQGPGSFQKVPVFGRYPEGPFPHHFLCLLAQGKGINIWLVSMRTSMSPALSLFNVQSNLRRPELFSPLQMSHSVGN